MATTLDQLEAAMNAEGAMDGLTTALSGQQEKTTGLAEELGKLAAELRPELENLEELVEMVEIRDAQAKEIPPEVLKLLGERCKAVSENLSTLKTLVEGIDRIRQQLQVAGGKIKGISPESPDSKELAKRARALQTQVLETMKPLKDPLKDLQAMWGRLIELAKVLTPFTELDKDKPAGG